MEKNSKMQIVCRLCGYRGSRAAAWGPEPRRLAARRLWPCAVVSPSQRSLSVRAAVSTSWTSSSWRCWTDTGTPSASSAPTVRPRWRTNVSPGQEASTARRISSSQCAPLLCLAMYCFCVSKVSQALHSVARAFFKSSNKQTKQSKRKRKKKLSWFPLLYCQSKHGLMSAFYRIKSKQASWAERK